MSPKRIFKIPLGSACFPTQIAEVDARQVEFKWRQEGQPVHQLRVIFLFQDEQQQPLLMQITGTSNRTGGMTSEERPAFFSIIDTLELRRPDVPHNAIDGKAVSV